MNSVFMFIPNKAISKLLAGKIKMKLPEEISEHNEFLAWENKRTGPESEEFSKQKSPASVLYSCFM